MRKERKLLGVWLYNIYFGARSVMVIVVGNGHGDTRMIAFHIALIPLGKVWIQLFSIQLWVNSRADCVFWLWLGNLSNRSKTLSSNLVNFALKIDLVSHHMRADGLVNTYNIYIKLFVFTQPLRRMHHKFNFFKQSIASLRLFFFFFFFFRLIV